MYSIFSEALYLSDFNFFFQVRKFGIDINCGLGICHMLISDRDDLGYYVLSTVRL